MKPRNFPGRKLSRQARAQGVSLESILAPKDAKFRLGAVKRAQALAQARAFLSK